MATKYKFTFKGNRSADTYTIDVDVLAYGGSPRIFAAAWGPGDCATLNSDTSEADPLYPVRSQLLTLKLFIGALDSAGAAFTESDYQSILFSADKAVKATLSRAATTLFIGWFVPQQQCSFTPYKPSEATLTFACGLSALSSRDIGATYDYKIQTFRELINLCLDEVGLQLDIRFSSTLYLGDYTDYIIDDVALEASALWASDGTGSLDYLSVLRGVLRAIGGVIYQRSGQWEIDCVYDKSQTVERFGTILFSAPSAAASITVGTIATQPLLTGRSVLERGFELSVSQPKAKVRASISYTQHLNLALNYLFRNFTANVPDNWTKSSGSIVTRQAGGGFANGVDIQGYANGTVGFVDEYVRSKGFEIKAGTRALIDWKFNTLAVDGVNVPGARVQIRINDKADFTGTTVNKSLQSDGTWASGIVWLQLGNNGTFTTPITIPDDGYIFLLIGRPHLPSLGIASQLTYYVSCEHFTATALAIRSSNSNLIAPYGGVEVVGRSPYKTIYNDGTDNLHLGHNEGETPYGIGEIRNDYYVTIYRNPSSRDPMTAAVNSAELLSSSGSLPQVITQLRSRLIGKPYISLDASLIGEPVELLQVYTYLVLGATRRLVCIGVENNLRRETQRAIFVDAELQSAAGISLDINFTE